MIWKGQKTALAKVKKLLNNAEVPSRASPFAIEPISPLTSLEICWQAGKIIQELYGANAPLLYRTIQKELEKEKLVSKGELTRSPVSIQYSWYLLVAARAND